MPGFGLSRYPVKFFFMTAFSLAVLAGMGMDYYVKNAGRDMALAGFLRKLLAATFVGSFIYFVFNFKFPGVFNFLYEKTLPFFIDKKDNLGQLIYAAAFNIKRAIGYFMILSVVLFLGARKKIKLNLAALILLFIAVLDIYTGNKKLYLNMDAEEYLKPGGTVEFLKRDKALYRIFVSPAALSQNMFVPEKDYFEGVRSLKERMVSNSGVVSGIYDAYGYGSLYNKRHEEVIKLITLSGLPDDTNLLNLLNVKYVVSPKDFEARGYRLAKKNGKANIYENEYAMPRVFLADRAVIIKDEKSILEKLKSKDFDPLRQVILEEDISFRMPGAGSLMIDKTRIIKYSPNEVIIEANVGESKFLVLSDSYYPGWKALVDGMPEKIYRADYILRAVHLEPGKHIVKFTYDPFSFKIGLIITFGTVFSLAAIWIKKR